jgi:hypothetical protein
MTLFQLWRRIQPITDLYNHVSYSTLTILTNAAILLSHVSDLAAFHWIIIQRMKLHFLSFFTFCFVFVSEKVMKLLWYIIVMA